MNFTNNLCATLARIEREQHYSKSIKPVVRIKSSEWYVWLPEPQRASIIMHRDKTMLYSAEGNVYEGTWEFSMLNRETIIARYNNKIHKFYVAYYNPSVNTIILQIADTEEYVVLTKENIDWYERLNQYFDKVQNLRRQVDAERENWDRERDVYNYAISQITARRIPIFSAFRFANFCIYLNVVLSILFLLLLSPVPDEVAGWFDVDFFAKFNLCAEGINSALWWWIMYIGLLIWGFSFYGMDNYDKLTLAERRVLYWEKLRLENLAKDAPNIYEQCKHYAEKRAAYLQKYIGEDGNVLMLFSQWLVIALCIGSVFVYRNVLSHIDSAVLILVVGFVSFLIILGLCYGISFMRRMILGKFNEYSPYDVDPLKDV